MPDQLTKAYYCALQRTQQHHAKKQGKTFSGRFTWKQHRDRIKDLIDRYEAKSVLDYGCGWGKQYQERDEQGRSLAEYWGVDPFKYDPGVPHYQAEPKGKYDLVICVQVLGSIPKADVPAIVDRLYGFANKAVFVAERIGVPHKVLFDDMKSEMPHGISAEEWMTLLRRPGSTISLIAAFHNEDPVTGWPGWRVEEEFRSVGQPGKAT